MLTESGQAEKPLGSTLKQLYRERIQAFDGPLRCAGGITAAQRVTLSLLDAVPCGGYFQYYQVFPQLPRPSWETTDHNFIR